VEDWRVEVEAMREQWPGEEGEERESRPGGGGGGGGGGSGSILSSSSLGAGELSDTLEVGGCTS
jgi:hypothetical protein